MPNSSLFRLLLLLLPLALLLAACPEVKPATAALVVVRADDDYVASQLSSIRAEVYPVDAKPGTEPRDTREFELARGRSGAGRVQLPFSFGIEKASAELFLLVVTGYRAGEAEAAIERKIVAGFEDQQTVLVEVVLSSICYGRADACSSLDETCHIEAAGATAPGSCGEVVEVPVQPVIAGRELDAASPGSMDAGGRDAAGPFTSPEGGPRADGGGPEDAAPFGNDEAAVIRCEPPRVEDGAGGCAEPVCALTPCQHGGACSDSAGGRICDCSAVDYEGASCETKIDDCARSPCSNGGVCTDGVRSRSCTCPPGTFGPDCAVSPSACAGSNVCAGATNGVRFSYPCSDSPAATSTYRCIGQFPDGPVSGSTPSAGRFSASDGVVTDAQTGLRWQQVPSPNVYPWAEAKAYCSRLTLAGGGWRLPSRAELTTLVHYGRVLPAIDSAAFPDTPHDAFWTSSPYVGAAEQAWAIFFSYGGTNNRSTSFSHYARCTR